MVARRVTSLGLYETADGEAGRRRARQEQTGPAPGERLGIGQDAVDTTRPQLLCCTLSPVAKLLGVVAQRAGVLRAPRGPAAPGPPASNASNRDASWSRPPAARCACSSACDLISDVAWPTSWR